MTTASDQHSETTIRQDERYSVATEDKIGAWLFGSASRKRRTEGAALFVVLAVISLNAASYVGLLVGWLIGASLSPIAQAVAPAIVGLLAVLGVSTKLRRSLSKRRMHLTGWREKRRAIWTSILAAGMVFVFCKSASEGIVKGIRSGTMPYTDIADLIGDSWNDADELAATAICAFTLQARAAGVPHNLYERCIWDIVKPIIEDDQPDKEARIETAIETMKQAFPKPRPEEPSKEPTGQTSAKAG
jgi:hypothetical protein